MNQASFLKNRLQKIQTHLQKNNLDAFLISDPFNITYLTGVPYINPFDREAFLILTSKLATLLASPLSIDKFKNSEHLNIKPFSTTNKPALILKNLKTKSLLIEEHDLKVSELDKLCQELELETHPSNQLIQKHRVIKDKLEIQLISKACQITATTWKQIKPQIKPGKTEIEIVDLIIQTQKKLGADGIPLGFDPIVASGVNSAIPHHHSSSRKITSTDTIVLDFGCTYQGYNSDFTRTICMNPKDKQFQQLDITVKTAYQKAIDSITTNFDPKLADQAARDFITKQGFGNKFIHTSGHGLGLAIHEPPTIYHKSTSTNKLKPNTVITIEPGIYLENKMGYRHENTLLITNKGYQTLTQPNK